MNQEALIIDLNQLGDSPIERSYTIPFSSDYCTRDDVVVTSFVFHCIVERQIGRIKVAGSVGYSVQGKCDRCLDPASVSVSDEVLEYFYPQGDEQGDCTYFHGQDSLDLVQLIRDSVLNNFPQVLLCSSQCKGICPLCGEKKGSELCKCEQSHATKSPFNILKN